ncbi:MAG: glycosyltransferase family 39 protein [Planctomycetaceae bacterium]
MRWFQRDALALWGLFALCLIPRLVAAWRLEVVCNDGYYYIRMAHALESGKTDELLAYLSLNVYPAILAGLHRLGLDWIWAGKAWGVFAASLAVLPIFGWVRAVFDRRVAFAAGFLYAIHPELTEVGVEPIREGTFWLFFCTSLWLLQRSVATRRLRWFALSGVMIALAIHTRTEGLVLVIPAVLWPLLRCSWDRLESARLLGGTVLCLAMTPLSIASVNLTLLRGQAEWEWGRLGPFKRVWNWAQETSPIPALATATPAPAAALAPRVSPRQLHPLPARPKLGPRPGYYLTKLVKALEPLNCVLLLIGMCLAWRRQDWRSKLVLGLMSWSLLGAVWIQLTESTVFNGRYFSTLYLVIVPYAGIGLSAAAQGVGRVAARRAWAAPGSPAPARLLALALTIFFWIDVATMSHGSRKTEADLGRAVHETYGPFRAVVVDPASIRVGYYTHSALPESPVRLADIFGTLGEVQPDLLIVRNPRLLKEKFRRQLVRQAEAQGLTEVDSATLPDPGSEYLVMVSADRLRRRTARLESVADRARNRAYR